MPKLRKRLPSYRLHKCTGQAVVTLNGWDIYLGMHGRPESRARYDELMGRWLANHRQVPANGSDALSVSELIVRYYRFCESNYAARRTLRKMLSRICGALRPFQEMFGTSPAAAIGPRAVMSVRSRYVEAGLARKTVNDNMQLIKRMFKWAVREELVPPSVHHGLSAVEGLRSGESRARDPRKVRPAPDSHVDAVLPHVLPPVRAMIELQRLTGMRSGEVTIMRTRDLDMAGATWVYRPAHHKSEGRGLEREIRLGPNAQAIIRPFLRAALEEYIFRPNEAEAERDAERRRRRVTPLFPSSIRRQERKRKRSPKRVPRDHYSVDTYGQAIRRGCQRAGVPKWTPHQLRHAYATRIRKEYGIEAARVMLGHRHMGVTEIYAERDQSIAETVAERLG